MSLLPFVSQCAVLAVYSCHWLDWLQCSAGASTGRPVSGHSWARSHSGYSPVTRLSTQLSQQWGWSGCPGLSSTPSGLTVSVSLCQVWLWFCGFSFVMFTGFTQLLDSCDHPSLTGYSWDSISPCRIFVEGHVEFLYLPPQCFRKQWTKLVVIQNQKEKQEWTRIWVSVTSLEMGELFI